MDPSDNHRSSSSWRKLMPRSLLTQNDEKHTLGSNSESLSADGDVTTPDTDADAEGSRVEPLPGFVPRGSIPLDPRPNTSRGVSLRDFQNNMLPSPIRKFMMEHGSMRGAQPPPIDAICVPLPAAAAVPLPMDDPLPMKYEREPSRSYSDLPSDGDDHVGFLSDDEEKVLYTDGSGEHVQEHKASHATSESQLVAASQHSRNQRPNTTSVTASSSRQRPPAVVLSTPPRPIQLELLHLSAAAHPTSNTYAAHTQANTSHARRSGHEFEQIEGVPDSGVIMPIGHKPKRSFDLSITIPESKARLGDIVYLDESKDSHLPDAKVVDGQNNLRFPYDIQLNARADEDRIKVERYISEHEAIRAKRVFGRMEMEARKNIKDALYTVVLAEFNLALLLLCLFTDEFSWVIYGLGLVLMLINGLVAGHLMVQHVERGDESDTKCCSGTFVVLWLVSFLCWVLLARETLQENRSASTAFWVAWLVASFAFLVAFLRKALLWKAIRKAKIALVLVSTKENLASFWTYDAKAKQLEMLSMYRTRGLSLRTCIDDYDSPVCMAKITLPAAGGGKIAAEGNGEELRRGDGRPQHAYVWFDKASRRKLRRGKWHSVYEGTSLGMLGYTAPNALPQLIVE